MQLVDWFLGVTLVSVAIGLIVASTRYFRRKMTIYVFSFTTVALFGLAISAVAKLVDAMRMMSWVGLMVMALAFYMLGRKRNSSGPEMRHADPR